MGIETALIVAAGAAAAGTAYSVYSGERAADAQQEAMRKQEQAQKEALDIQKRQAKAAEQNINRANRKQPDVAEISQQSQAMAGQGGGSTMLTGPQGVNPNELALGKSTLLGG